MSFLFKKKVDPKEQAAEWQKTVRTETRKLDRQIYDIEKEEKRIKTECQKAAKSGDTTVLKMFARELIRSRKAKERILISKAQLNSVGLQIKQQHAQIKIAAAFGKSTELMALMNSICKVPELTAVAREMGKEMAKAGLIEEMMNDTFESLDEDNLDAEADEEIDKVVAEIMSNSLGQAGRVGTKIMQPVHAAAAQEEDEPEMDAMAARLSALRQES